METPFAAKAAGKRPRKRRRHNVPMRCVLREGDWMIRLVADSRRLLKVELSSDKRPQEEASTLLLRKAKRALRRYFREGRPLEKMPLDWSLQSPFQRKVLRCVQRIPFGKVRSYGWVTRQIGIPRGARSCGQALRRNRFPLFIPCHRVVGQTGLGGFSCGVRLKEKLLSHEQRFSSKRGIR